MLTRWVFLRGLGLVYLIAFISLGSQVIGLVGSQGVLPAGEFLERVQQHLQRTGGHPWARLPTLAWWGSSDAHLQGYCAAGAALAACVVLRIVPAVALLGCWGLYLSLLAVGQTFLSFQWDILLLETGFLAVLLAPWTLRPRGTTEPDPPPAALWLLRFLLFRLMFQSGVVKLVDDGPDRAWHRLEALHYHYETQPLPTWIGWYAHQLPGWCDKFCVAAMFGIELAVPFLIFLPRRPRLFGMYCLVLLQVVILLTGNYNFFNLLTILLCLLLADDAWFWRWMPRRLRARLQWAAPPGETGRTPEPSACARVEEPVRSATEPAGSTGAERRVTGDAGLADDDNAAASSGPPDRAMGGGPHSKAAAPPGPDAEDAALPSAPRRKAPRVQRIVCWLCAVPIVVVGLTQTWSAFVSDRGARRDMLNRAPWRYAQAVMGWSGRFHLVNSYGLFRRMTTQRPEIILEGSQDGREWLAYEFKWKPGDPSRPPQFVQPHQPRLDWQMWFAALGTYQHNPWLLNLMKRLLEGSPAVLELLEYNPFPGGPPRFVRAQLYQYRFTDLPTLRSEGQWWRRDYQVPYTPVLTLRDGALKAVPGR